MATLERNSFAIVTASSGVFTRTDEGREVWKKYDSNGDGGGRARILQVYDATSALVKVLSPFDSDDEISASNWYFTVSGVRGLEHLEGETVSVVCDGGPHPDVQVKNGEIALQYQASVVFIGYKYRGIIESLNLDNGGVIGPAQGKPRNVYGFMVHLLNSIGVKIGTTPYNLQKLPFRDIKDKMGRPAPPYNGNYEVTFSDTYNKLEKKAWIVQDDPLPCNVLSLDIFMDTVDE